jgi:hypothetical protein
MTPQKTGSDDARFDVEILKGEIVDAHPADKMQYAGVDFEEICSLIVDYLFSRNLLNLKKEES